MFFVNLIQKVQPILGVMGFSFVNRISNIFSKNEAVLNFLKIILASLLLGLSSKIRIPLVLSPVPITCQTLVVMLIGSFMGSRLGFFAILAYLIEGAFFLPMFSSTLEGIFSLSGPVGGYLTGFLLQVYLVGLYQEKWAARSSVLTLIFLVCVCFLQLGAGALWLSRFIGIDSAIKLGFIPFIAGEVMKSAIVALYLRKRD